MTNGEKIKEVFPTFEFIKETEKYRTPQHQFLKVHGVNKMPYMEFDLGWWNAEYKEPTTKTCKTCRNFDSHHGICEICKDNKCWTEKEPTTKNDLADGKDNNVTSKITREEVIEQLQDAKIGYKEYLSNDALDMAISALEHPERNVVAIVPCGDAISRQEAIDTIRQLYLDLASQKAVIDILKVLPSVTPIRPKGHWEHGRELSRVFIGDALRGINYEDWHCSNCHCVIEQSIKPKWNYCPNCGADMREVEV